MKNCECNSDHAFLSTNDPCSHFFEGKCPCCAERRKTASLNRDTLYKIGCLKTKSVVSTCRRPPLRVPVSDHTLSKMADTLKTEIHFPPQYWNKSIEIGRNWGDLSTYLFFIQPPLSIAVHHHPAQLGRITYQHTTILSCEDSNQRQPTPTILYHPASLT